MYSFQDGERGYLEGLASRYADLFSTHYGDVLSHLEDLRRRDWAEMSPRDRIAITPGTPQEYGPATGTPVSGSASGHGMTSSQSQPIYVPGKYSVKVHYILFSNTVTSESVSMLSLVRYACFTVIDVRSF